MGYMGQKMYGLTPSCLKVGFCCLCYNISAHCIYDDTDEFLIIKNDRMI